MEVERIAAEIQTVPNQTDAAARTLKELGFRVLHIGPTISTEGPKDLWESTFNLSFIMHTKESTSEAGGGQVTYLKPRSNRIVVPPNLQHLIEEVMFAEPPDFF